MCIKEKSKDIFHSTTIDYIKLPEYPIIPDILHIAFGLLLLLLFRIYYPVVNILLGEE